MLETGVREAREYVLSCVCLAITHFYLDCFFEKGLLHRCEHVSMPMNILTSWRVIAANYATV